MFENKQDKQRKQTRERVRRFRQKQKQEGDILKKQSPATVTSPLQTVTEAKHVTVGGVTDTKMICKCQYYKTENGVMVCAQCGKPAGKKPVEDKIWRGVLFK